eukprot:15356445-Ditylum_brightwellii.AAC.1
MEGIAVLLSKNVCQIDLAINVHSQGKAALDCFANGILGIYMYQKGSVHSDCFATEESTHWAVEPQE